MGGFTGRLLRPGKGEIRGDDHNPGILATNLDALQSATRNVAGTDDGDGNPCTWTSPPLWSLDADPSTITDWTNPDTDGDGFRDGARLEHTIGDLF